MRNENTNGSMDKVHVRVVIKFLRLAITVLLRVLRRKIHYLHMEDMCMMIVVRLRILLLVGSGIQKAMRL